MRYPDAPDAPDAPDVLDTLDEYQIPIVKVLAAEEQRRKRKKPEINHVMNKKQSREMISFITVTSLFRRAF